MGDSLDTGNAAPAENVFLPTQGVFQYHALKPAIKEIRLLNLPPTNDPNSELKVTISYAPLEASSFHALSYTWGDPKDKREITLQGQKFPVTTNLFAALKAISLQINDSIMIWVDAVCINQNDTKEKEQQVKMMTDLYRSAEETLIWLGEGDAETDALLDFMDKMGAASLKAGIMRLGEDDFKNRPDSDPEKAALEKAKLKLIRSTPSFPILPLTELSCRKWFSRVWIIQELSVARKVTFICGSKWIDGNRFIAAFRFAYDWLAKQMGPLMDSSGWKIVQLFKKGWVIWKHWAYIKIMIERNREHKLNVPSARAANTLGMRQNIAGLESDSNAAWSPRHSLMHHLILGFTLSTAGPLEATVPKDRIYALLGISKDRNELGIHENYDKSVTYQHVYAETAKALIQHGNYDILSLCRSPNKGHLEVKGQVETEHQIERDAQLPSWAPDWTKRMITPWGGFIEDGMFDSSKGMDDIGSAVEPISTEWNILTIEAMFVGNVTKLGTPWRPSWDDKFDYAGAHVLFEEVEAFVKDSGSQYTDAQKQDAIWRIPIGNKKSGAFGKSQRLGPGRGTEYNEYAEMRAIAAKNHKLGEEFPRVAPTVPSCLSLLKDMYDARPMLTDTGYVGLCADCGKEGDEVWIIRGANVPYVLRKSGMDTWRLIGEAFVYGMMDGEICGTGASLKSLRLV